MSKRYIEKESLLVWLENMLVDEYIIKAIDNNIKFPPANVEEKIQGEWIMRLNDCECSNCKTRFRFNKADIDTYSNFYNFDRCPKCGAIMTNSYCFKRRLY